MSNKSYYRTTVDGSVAPIALVPNGDGTYSESAGSGTGGSGGVSLAPDAAQAKLTGGRYTLASTSTVVSVAIPDFARGVRLRPTADTRFAINENPVASGVDALTVGNTAYAGESDVRLIASGTGRTLRLLTTVAASTIGIGFFG